MNLTIQPIQPIQPIQSTNTLRGQGSRLDGSQVVILSCPASIGVTSSTLKQTLVKMTVDTDEWNRIERNPIKALQTMTNMIIHIIYKSINIYQHLQ